MAKYHLGKVRLELMQPTVFPSTIRDLRGGPHGIFRALVFHCTTCAAQLAGLCGLIICTAQASEFFLILAWIIVLCVAIRKFTNSK